MTGGRMEIPTGGAPVDRGGQAQEARTCKTCGSPMVLGTVKRGWRKGQPVWYCSDFECPTFVNIDDEDITPSAPSAGESAQARFERERMAYTERVRRGAPFLAAVGVLVAVVMFFAALAVVETRFAAIAAMVTALAFLWYVVKELPSDVIYWGRGAEAERRVGVALETLEPHGFVVLHDRRAVGRGGNIDSIAVGPQGVFVIETKYRGRGVEIVQGRLEVGGREQVEVIRQVTDLAILVQVTIADEVNAHRMTVAPVICIGNRSVSGGERVGGVLVTDTKSVSQRLTATPILLEPEAVQEIAKKLDYALPAYERRQ